MNRALSTALIGIGAAQALKIPLFYAKMDDLIDLAKVQNFVPVVDDSDKFIGIVRRSDIIEYCAKQMFKTPSSS